MRKIILLICTFLVLSIPYPVMAQEGSTAAPIYIVQSGDTITSIATRFGITADELIAANSITNANLLAVGDELLIPGLEGVTGYLVTKPVAFGQTLATLAVTHRVDRGLLVFLNHLTSPSELYTGVNLIIPEDRDSIPLQQKFRVGNSQSLLEFALLSGTNPWSISAINQLSNQNTIASGQVLYLPAATEAQVKGLLQVPAGDIEISPLPFIQGKTITFKLTVPEGAIPGGSITGHELHFFPDGNGSYVALQGIHAMQEPGIYPLQITLLLSDGTQYTQEQMVIIQDGYYQKDPVLIVDPEYIDPAATEPELKWLEGITLPATGQKLWDGMWINPSPSSLDCINSKYGNRRSYNNGPFDFFHTGIDFCGGEQTPIYAPAVGRVVFAGPLTVRGNTTIIDHGWGVYTGYWHQLSMNVKEGDIVTPGQVIGLVGATGRVTGAHLHWEVWAGGVQVSPLEWLQSVYP